MLGQLIGSDRAESGHRIAGRQAIGEQRQTLETNAQICVVWGEAKTHGDCKTKRKTCQFENEQSFKNKLHQCTRNAKPSPRPFQDHFDDLSNKSPEDNHIPSRLSQIVRCDLTCLAFSISTALASLRNSCADCSSISSSLRVVANADESYADNYRMVKIHELSNTDGIAINTLSAVHDPIIYEH